VAEDVTLICFRDLRSEPELRAVEGRLDDSPFRDRSLSVRFRRRQNGRCACPQDGRHAGNLLQREMQQMIITVIAIPSPMPRTS
jgi:hypothetical protein